VENGELVDVNMRFPRHDMSGYSWLGGTTSTCEAPSCKWTDFTVGVTFTMETPPEDYTYVCVYVCMHVCECVYVCMYVYVCVYVYACVCMYVCVRMYVCVCMHASVCMHLYIYIYLRTSIYTFAPTIRDRYFEGLHPVGTFSTY